jgi:hypothetical protein
MVTVITVLENQSNKGEEYHAGRKNMLCEWCSERKREW